MTPFRLLAAPLILGAFVSYASAAPAPKHSMDYPANVKTLVDDQGASPDIAACVATGYDYVQAAPDYDRLGFTRNDFASAERDRDAAPFSPQDPRRVTGVLSVSGEARQRSDGTWLGVTLRCGYAGKGLTAVEIVTDAAQD